MEREHTPPPSEQPERARRKKKKEEARFAAFFKRLRGGESVEGAQSSATETTPEQPERQRRVTKIGRKIGEFMGWRTKGEQQPAAAPEATEPNERLSRAGRLARFASRVGDLVLGRVADVRREVHAELQEPVAAVKPEDEELLARGEADLSEALINLRETTEEVGIPLRAEVQSPPSEVRELPLPSMPDRLHIPEMPFAAASREVIDKTSETTGYIKAAVAASAGTLLVNQILRPNERRIRQELREQRRQIRTLERRLTRQEDALALTSAEKPVISHETVVNTLHMAKEQTAVTREVDREVQMAAQEISERAPRTREVPLQSQEVPIPSPIVSEVRAEQPAEKGETPPYQVEQERQKPSAGERSSDEIVTPEMDPSTLSESHEVTERLVGEATATGDGKQGGAGGGGAVGGVHKNATMSQNILDTKIPRTSSTIPQAKNVIQIRNPLLLSVVAIIATVIGFVLVASLVG